MNKGMNSSAPFFIIGAQRSGTTLLRLMLNAHSCIAIPEEGTFWMPLLRKYGSLPQRKIQGHRLYNYLGYIKNNPQFNLWGCKQKNIFETIRNQRDGCTLAELMIAVYRGYAQRQGKTIFGDKTPSFFRMIPILNRLFPNARFINLVRDGRDIYLSAKKMDPARRNISVAALEWSHKVREASRALLGFSAERQITVRYEDLVSDPQTTLEKICNFLQVSFEPNMLGYWQNSDQFIGAHHSQLIFSPVSSSSVEKWKKELTEQEISRYQYIAGKILKEYDYEIDLHSKNKWQSMVGVFYQLVFGLPVRAVQVFCTTINLNIAARFGMKTCAAGKGEPPARMSEKQE